MQMKWISVKEALPKCLRRKRGSFCCVVVLIWPRDPMQTACNGFTYYGQLAGRPEFFTEGGPVMGVTHWMPMPEGPKVSSKRKPVRKKG